MTDLPHLSFAIPPSLGSDATPAVAARLEKLLRLGGLDVGVYPCDSYGGLSLELMTERADLAWAPPSVCARMEVMGAQSLVQSVRGGALTYRSAFVVRKGETLDLAAPPSTTRAVWVDPDSTAGYLLPRAWFWSRGIDIRKAFSDSRFAGSYRVALHDVIEGKADVTAVYATVSGADRARSALADVPGLEDQLDIIAFTEDAPGDGVISRASLPSLVRKEVRRRLISLCDNVERAAEFRALFGAERLVEAKRDAYQALHDIVKLDESARGVPR